MVTRMDKQSPPWFWPFLKRLYKPTHDPLIFFQSLIEQHDIVRLPVLKANYLINDPEAIHHILLANSSNYTKAGTSYERIEHVVGKGLLTSSGEDWATRRQKYQPLFHGKHLRAYVDTIYKYTEAMLSNWEGKNKEINLTNDMLALVMNITSDSFLGVDVSDRSEELVRVVHILNEYSVKSLVLWKWLPTLKNLRYQVAKKTVDNFILDSIKYDNDKEPLLKGILQKNEAGEFIFSKDYILGDVKNFFVAGHETTGNALCWTLYCLAKNTYVLKQVVTEIKQVLGSKLPDFDTIETMPYLGAVVQEVLRLYPPIWIFTRRAIEEDMLQNYKIPAGAIINILPYLIHRHPKYWNQPNIFYPERFLPDLSKGRPKCAYIPFGFGPRVCIGRQFALLNLKIIIIMLLQRFEIELPYKSYHVDPLPLITLKPKKEIKLKINKRG